MVDAFGAIGLLCRIWLQKVTFTYEMLDTLNHFGWKIITGCDVLLLLTRLITFL